jgi:hypothetical protein
MLKLLINWGYKINNKKYSVKLLAGVYSEKVQFT